MVKAWYLDDKMDDPRLPHMTNPPVMVDLEMLKERTGVTCFQFDPVKFERDGHDPLLDKMKEANGYTYEDKVVIGTDFSKKKLAEFYTEHMHADDEIRFVIDGSGYFDVRDHADRWVRIMVEKGDLLIEPAGVYHKFTPDTNDYIVARRYFVGVPVWTPINRPAEEHPTRKAYLEKYKDYKIPAC